MSLQKITLLTFSPSFCQQVYIGNIYAHWALIALLIWVSSFDTIAVLFPFLHDLILNSYSVLLLSELRYIAIAGVSYRSGSAGSVAPLRIAIFHSLRVALCIDCGGVLQCRPISVEATALFLLKPFSHFRYSMLFRSGSARKLKFQVKFVSSLLENKAKYGLSALLPSLPILCCHLPIFYCGVCCYFSHNCFLFIHSYMRLQRGSEFSFSPRRL